MRNKINISVKSIYLILFFLLVTPVIFAIQKKHLKENKIIEQAIIDYAREESRNHIMPDSFFVSLNNMFECPSSLNFKNTFCFHPTDTNFIMQILSHDIYFRTFYIDAINYTSDTSIIISGYTNNILRNDKGSFFSSVGMSAELLYKVKKNKLIFSGFSEARL